MDRKRFEEIMKLKKDNDEFENLKNLTPEHFIETLEEELKEAERNVRFYAEKCNRIFVILTKLKIEIKENQD